MKIFISWSGTVSHKFATILKDWLPSIIQQIDAFVSSEDVDKGARWVTDIAKHLDESSFGIVCVTKDNIGSKWLNFEAGALGKSVGKAKVCPVLFGASRSDVTGPLLQFQSSTTEKHEIYKLLKTINTQLDKPLEQDKLGSYFEVWWPKLDQQIKELHNTETETTEPRSTQDILDESILLARSTYQLLRENISCEKRVIVKILENGERKITEIPEAVIDERAVQMLLQISYAVLCLVRDNPEKLSDKALTRKIEETISSGAKAIEHLEKKMGTSLPMFLLRQLF